MGTDDRSSEFKKAQSQLGADATIQREQVTGDLPAEMNRRLREIGEASNPVPQGARYLGSMAVHIYYNDTFSQPFFISQHLLKDVNDILASMAAQDLIGRAMEAKGHRAPKKRSNW